MSKPMFWRIMGVAGDTRTHCVVNMNHITAIYYGMRSNTVEAVKVIRIHLVGGDVIELVDGENNRKVVEDALQRAS